VYEEISYKTALERDVPKGLPVYIIPDNSNHDWSEEVIPENVAGKSVSVTFTPDQRILMAIEIDDTQTGKKLKDIISNPYLSSISMSSKRGGFDEKVIIDSVEGFRTVDPYSVTKFQRIVKEHMLNGK
jgi:hypothetical protein